MLPEAFKTNWIKALRSGEYEQATGELVDVTKDNCYCTFGLAGHVAGVSDEDMKSNALLIPTMTGIEKVPKDLIFTGAVNEVVDKIIDMNDFKEIPFAEIADYIEQNL